MMQTATRILVLGVGNILFTDEGLGVRCIEAMRDMYRFSDNVTLMDGGTLGTRLIGDIMESDMLIVCDAVLCDAEPGAVFRLVGEDLRRSLTFRDSMHQTDLVDVLTTCGLIGNRPDVVIIGMEPADYQTMGLELSPVVREAQPAMIDALLREIVASGGEYSRI